MGSRVKGQGSRENKTISGQRRGTASGMIAYLILVLPLVACLGGCGYHLVRDEGIRGGDVKVVDVPMFKNKTFEPHTPAIFTEAFTRELLSSGFFQINKSNPDSTLQGTIARIHISHSSLGGTTALVVEKSATVDVELTLTKNTGQVLRHWKLTESEPFRADDVNLEDFYKRAALKRAAARMSRRFSSLVLADY
jgi:hypothetical protein